MQTLLAICCLIFINGSPPAWLGFLGQGAAAVDPATIPTTWSPSENVAWKSKFPGKGQSSPVIRGDQVFVTAIEGTMKDFCSAIAHNTWVEVNSTEVPQNSVLGDDHVERG